MTTAPQPLSDEPFEGHSDTGSVPAPGSVAYDPDRQAFTIRGAGEGPGSERAGFHFVFRRMTGDFILTARAAFGGAQGSPLRELGWMARAGLGAESAAVCAGVRGDGAVLLRFPGKQGGQSEETEAPVRGADVIQLERSGSTFTLSAARFGEPFTTAQVEEIDLGEEVYVGLYASSGGDPSTAQAVFDNLRIVVPARPGFDRSRDPFGSRLEILDMESGLRRVLYARDDVFEAPNWTRDGKALIFNSGGRLYRFDLQTRQPSLIDTGDVIHNNNDHVLSFDGSMLAVSSHGGAGQHSLVFTVPVSGGQPRQITPVGPSYLHGWSPDGKYLVYTAFRDGDFDIYRIPSAGGSETRLTTAPGLDDGPEYTPDGRHIYFNSVRSGLMQIWRMKADGSDQEQLTDDEFNNWFPHIAPDGRSLIFISYLASEVAPGDHPPAKRVMLRTMPLDGGAPKVVAYLYGGQGTINVPSWSPDGEQVAFVSNTVPFPAR